MSSFASRVYRRLGFVGYYVGIASIPIPYCPYAGPGLGPDHVYPYKERDGDDVDNCQFQKAMVSRIPKGEVSWTWECEGVHTISHR